LIEKVITLPLEDGGAGMDEEEIAIMDGNR
jgi:hypothetical protein